MLLDPLPEAVVAQRLEPVHRLVRREREVAEVPPRLAHGLVLERHLRDAAAALRRDGHVAAGPPHRAFLQLDAGLELFLHLEETSLEGAFPLATDVRRPEHVDVEALREAFLRSRLPVAAAESARLREHMLPHECRAADVRVERADALRAVELVLQLVDRFAHPLHVRVDERQELLVAKREFGHVRLARVAVIRHDERLRDPERLQLRDGVADGNDVGDVSRLLGEGDVTNWGLSPRIFLEA